MSFSETSKRLFLTQSALSRHIATMEEELGAKLLVRDSHHVRPTEVGKAFLKDSTLTVQAFDNSIDHVERIKQGAKPTLRIGYLYDAGRSHLPRIKKALDRARIPVVPQYQALEYGQLEKKGSSVVSVGEIPA